MHLFDRRAVSLGFGGGNYLKRLFGERLRPVRKTTRRDQRLDVCQMPMLVMMVMFVGMVMVMPMIMVMVQRHVKRNACKSPFANLLYRDAVAVEWNRCESRTNLRLVAA